MPGRRTSTTTLVKVELTAYLRDSREAFDLIVSADTLVYFGELEDVVAAAAGALAAGRTARSSRSSMRSDEADAAIIVWSCTAATRHARGYVERVLARRRS